MVFTDSNGEIKKASEYKSNGPKEEVYLDEDQSVTFSLKDWDPNTNKLYLGVKAPFGNAKVSVNGQILELKNAADCYYEISKCADISEKTEARELHLRSKPKRDWFPQPIQM